MVQAYAAQPIADVGDQPVVAAPPGQHQRLTEVRASPADQAGVDDSRVLPRTLPLNGAAARIPVWHPVRVGMNQRVDLVHVVTEHSKLSKKDVRVLAVHVLRVGHIPEQVR